MPVRSALPALGLGILAAGLAVRPVRAATASGSFSVSATVEVSCLVSATTPSFIGHPSASDAASAISVACSNSTPYSVSLSTAMVTDLTVEIPRMTGSGFALPAYPPSPNFRSVANWRRTMSSEVMARFGDRSSPQLPIPRQLWAQRAVSGTDANTIIVVVTY